MANEQVLVSILTKNLNVIVEYLHNYLCKITYTSRYSGIIDITADMMTDVLHDVFISDITHEAFFELAGSMAKHIRIVKATLTLPDFKRDIMFLPIIMLPHRK